ncbi:MAG: hypothetical protein E6R03_13925 [Hyphomicrobiaceae bacterium]|nr:MAG: hypothetical protein E6R03_13925 [Hyphomicrobiaceae bacterium]
MNKILGFARRHKAALLLLMFLGVAAPYSPPFFKLVAGTGFTFSTQTVYPGGSFTVSLPSVGPGAGSYPTSGQVPTFTLDALGRVTAAGSTTTLTSPVIGGSPSLTANLAAGSNKITGLAAATATGDALSYPWITSSAGISVLGSTYTITADNGAYEDTGLSVTLPSAGTYVIWYTARTNVVAAGAAGAFIEVELYNSTDGSALANSEEIGAYASTVTASYYGTPHLTTTASVVASKVIKLYAKSVAPSSTTTRTVNSDTNGRTNLGYMKISL